MNLEEFWAIIETGKDIDDPMSVVKERLKALPPEEIVSYQAHFDTLHEKAYQWKLWGAAYIIIGGASDDTFTDFRYGLISRGREFYDNALKDPDSLADKVDVGEEFDDELFGYLALEVYEDVTGKDDIPRKPYEAPPEPVGEEWDFEDENENNKRLPKLTKKFWGNW